MRISGFLKQTLKKAYLAPVAISLFLIPIFWNPAFAFSFTQGKELFFKITIIATSLIIAAFIFFKKNWEIKNLVRSPIFLLVVTLSAIMAITNALSPTPIVALHGTYSRGFGFIIRLFLLIFLIYTALNFTKQDIYKILKIFFFSSLIIAFYAVLQALGLDLFFQSFDINIFAGREFSFSGNPSYLGQTMLLSFLIGISLMIFVKEKSAKLFYLIGSGFLIIGLFLSGTRTAIVGLLFGSLILTIKYFSQILQLLKKNKLIIGLISLLAVFSLLILPHDRYSLSEISLRSLNSRLEIWDGAIELIAEKPFLGYGEETFYIYFPEIVTKDFFTLEENINLNADRIHNETLEIFFSHGLFALFIYIFLFVFLLKTFFQSKNHLTTILSLVIISNIIQNQFSFPDISISILIAFCYGSLIALESGKKFSFQFSSLTKFLVPPIIIIFSLFVGFFTVYKPYQSQLFYKESLENYSISYEKAIISHKKALQYTPYYSELWYELMILDPSSMERALWNLEKIEGNSGNILAWKGNFYANTDPQKASEYYLQALEKNPYHPNWVRAFADMLYQQGDYANSLFLYDKYLDSVPDFWQWSEELEKRTKQEQESYQTFFKHTPYFWGIIDKMNNILSISDQNSQENF